MTAFLPALRVAEAFGSPLPRTGSEKLFLKTFVMEWPE